ncbi:MAG: hypothetical protein AAGM22_27190 [Acidobacteriota bacterium]
MPRGRKVKVRNAIGDALVQRRNELGLPRHLFRWRYRLEQIEGTAKIKRALRLLSLEGSQEILETLGFTWADLEALAAEELSLEEALERARAKVPPPAPEPTEDDG